MDFTRLLSLLGIKGKDGSTIASDANPVPVQLPAAQNTVLQEIADNTASISIDADTVNLNTDTLEAKLDTIIERTDVAGNARHSRLLASSPLSTERFKFDIPTDLTSGYIYKGLNLRTAAEADATWAIARYKFSASKLPTENDFLDNVSWTGRAGHVWV